LVRLGVTTKRLAQSRYKNGRWFVEVQFSDFTNKSDALDAVSWYLRTEFDAHGITSAFRNGSPHYTFTVGFYSDAL
jgi:hypothetical protein